MLPNDSSPSASAGSNNKAAAPGSLRRWLVWIILAALVPVLFVVSKNSPGESQLLTRQEFMELLSQDRIVRGAIHYNPQSSMLNEITGYYTATNANGRAEEKRFRIKTKLTGAMEARLLNSGTFEADEPNTVLASLFFTFLPILLVAALIYFFFIRQIKLATRAANPELAHGELLSSLDRVLIESARQVTKPPEPLFVRMHLADHQTIEGEILWVDPNYIKYRSATEKREYVVPKSSVLRFERA